MKKSLKKILASASLVFVSGTLLLALFLKPQKAEARIAYGCKYTGSYASACFYGGYKIFKCQYGYPTSCAYYPSVPTDN